MKSREHVIGKEEKKGTKAIFEATITENFPQN